MRIRRATIEDLPVMQSICANEPLAAQWSQAQWRVIFEQPMPRRMAWLVECECGVVNGFLVARCEPEWRRRGAGRELIRVLILVARAAGAERILLEVREQNRPAIALYILSGFEEISRRRNYYEHPPDDALILVHNTER